jgi:hypothetical protein
MGQAPTHPNEAMISIHLMHLTAARLSAPESSVSLQRAAAGCFGRSTVEGATMRMHPEGFVRQDRGPYRFDRWQWPEPVPTPLGT